MIQGKWFAWWFVDKCERDPFRSVAVRISKSLKFVKHVALMTVQVLTNMYIKNTAILFVWPLIGHAHSGYMRPHVVRSATSLM